MQDVLKKLSLLEQRLRNHYGKHIHGEITMYPDGSGHIIIERLLCDSRSLDKIYVFNFSNYEKLEEWGKNEGVSGCVEE